MFRWPWSKPKAAPASAAALAVLEARANIDGFIVGHLAERINALQARIAALELAASKRARRRYRRKR